MNFEQIVAFLSLGVAFTSVFANLITAHNSNKSAKKRMLTERRINCYCNLIDTLILMHMNGPTKENIENYIKHSTSSRMLTDKSDYEAVSSAINKVDESNFDMDAIGKLLKILRNIVNDK